jgi:hypothetical protein
MTTKYKPCAFARDYYPVRCSINHTIAELRGDTPHAWEFCCATKKVPFRMDQIKIHDPDKAKHCPFYTADPEEAEKVLSEENRGALERCVKIFAGKDRYFGEK